MYSACTICNIVVLVFFSSFPTASTQIWTPIVVKNVIDLGPQITPEVSNVSRDGGYSVLINEHIVWLYDDTECLDLEGSQLSFISNTAAYADRPNQNISTVTDFGAVMVGHDNHGRKNYAILADKTVGTGGWIPFEPEELDFNEEMNGKQRVAIWPGTSPTPVSTTQAFLFAPLVYVDSKPQDPSKEYQARGMTLVSISAPGSGPVAIRQGDLVIPGTEIAFGGFSTLLGSLSTDGGEDLKDKERDVYLLGMTDGGLQIARVRLNDITAYDKYKFFDPRALNFTTVSPKPDVSDFTKIYLPGTFSSGGVFYSPYFNTFIMVYFNKLVDSTFFVRFLDIETPIGKHAVWIKGGKNGKGIQAEDAEALVKYAWSPQQKLYSSQPGKGGFNYAGVAHPEYFNRQYFAKSLYPEYASAEQRKNDWYGSKLIAEAHAGGDGKHLLLSWTSQLQGGKDAGIYRVQLAVVEFGEIPVRPGARTSTTLVTSAPSMTSGVPLPSLSTTTQKSMDMNMRPKGSKSGDSLGSLLTYNSRIMMDICVTAGKVAILLSVIGIGALLL